MGIWGCLKIGAPKPLLLSVQIKGLGHPYFEASLNHNYIPTVRKSWSITELHCRPSRSTSMRLWHCKDVPILWVQHHVVGWPRKDARRPVTYIFPCPTHFNYQESLNVIREFVGTMMWRENLIITTWWVNYAMWMSKNWNCKPIILNSVTLRVSIKALKETWKSNVLEVSQA